MRLRSTAFDNYSSHAPRTLYSCELWYLRVLREEPVERISRSGQCCQSRDGTGPTYVVPGGRMGIQVHAPHVTVAGVPLQASADLSSSGEPSRFDLIQTWDLKEGRFFTGQNALRARLRWT
jgi:hypothetical protein